MSKKTITKKILFVISCLAFAAGFSGCFTAASKDEKQIASNSNRQEIPKKYGKSEVVGKIKSGEITESSGIVASLCNENALWTHNDSGDGAFIFAFDKKGEKLGTYKITAAKNVDWEDIAAFKDAQGKCFLYVADIGNNSGARKDFEIYAVAEPKISAADKTSSRKNPVETETARLIKFDYPDTPRDAETLLIQPQSGDVYVLTKRLDAASGVYKLPIAKIGKADKINRLEKVSDFTVPSIPNGFLTGGDISPDGKRVVVCDYLAAYEITLPEKAKNFDEIWREKPSIIELGERKQGEAIAYSTDGNSIFATSEKLNSPIIEVRRK
jgi:hypothetical protein